MIRIIIRLATGFLWNPSQQDKAIETYMEDKKHLLMPTDGTVDHNPNSSQLEEGRGNST